MAGVCADDIIVIRTESVTASFLRFCSFHRVLIIISASTEMLVRVVALRPPHPTATANVLQGHDSQFQPESQSQPPPPAEQQLPPPPDDAGPRQPSEPTAAEPQPEHSVDYSGRTQRGDNVHELGGGDDGACTSASIEELISRCEHRES